MAQILMAILAPAAFGLLTLQMPQRASWTPIRVATALCGPVAAFFLILGVMLGGGLSSPATGVWPWLPTLNINLAFFTDGLGGFFGLLVAGIGAGIVLYARGYFGRQGPTSSNDLYRFYPMLGFFMTAMLGLVLSDYTLLTLLFWEMTSISSFFLIGWNRDDKKSVKLAMQAFFTTGLGGLMLFGGLLMLGNNTGLWRWSELIPAAVGAEGVAAIDWSTPRLGWALGLMFIGAAAKSAQWPLHYWLPGAMAAPTPVSAFLHSATMVKAGVFLIGRLLPIFGQHEIWVGLIVPFGALTMLYGGVFAVMQHDLKRIFAYTTVSQLGLLMTMYGLGGLTYTDSEGHGYANIDYAVTQIANHAFYKAPLFIAAGAIGHVASRKLPELFGAFKKHKMICLTMLLAGYGLAAGPGTISFQAKELFLYAVVHGAKEHPVLWLVLVMTILTAACNVAIFVRLLTTLMGWKTGLGAANAGDDAHDADHGHDDHPHEHGVMAAMIWIPGLVLVSFQYLGGFFPGLIWTPIFEGLDGSTAHNYIAHAYHDQVPNLWQVLTHPGLPLLASVLAIGLGVALGLSRLLRNEATDINDGLYPATYWLCVTGGGVLFRAFQNGRFTHYVLVSLGAALVGFWGIAPREPGMTANLDLGSMFEHPVLLLLGVMVCFTAAAIPFARARIVRVVMLGACGFSVVGMYLVYQAPDLALTQLMVEIISVILFVIVLRLLPAQKDAKPPAWGRVGRLGFAALAGITFGWMTLVSATSDPEVRLGTAFAQHSYENAAYADDGSKVQAVASPMNTTRGGGGDNIVNVILVDFRGFDTYGEITVLGIAALGVWAMLPGAGLRRKSEPDVAPGGAP
ncbi:MAG: hydrogen gas-evolving membrane-bound hydrogenase subunit E [Planctomycetota bacterium]